MRDLLEYCMPSQAQTYVEVILHYCTYYYRRKSRIILCRNVLLQAHDFGCIMHCEFAF